MRRFLTILWLLLAPGAVSAATVDDVRSAMAADDYERSIELVMPLAADGNPVAQYLLGLHHDGGLGTVADPAKALELFRQAGAQGHAESLRVVGIYYEEGKVVDRDYFQAAKYYEQASDKGNAKAQRNLARLYLDGRGVEADQAKAADLLRRSAANGNAKAKRNLAYMYYFGAGVPRDLKRAAELFAAAADDGVGKAEYDLGRLYYRGRDAVALARSAGVESVARLLWGQDRLDPFTQPPPAPPADRTGLEGLPRCQALLPVAAAGDLRAYNQEPSGVAATGARILRLVVGLLAGARPTTAPLERQLARGWGCEVEAAEPLLRMALILCADHELNASAFAVRVVAATRATPYGAVLAGLAALQGPRHGGQAALVTRMLAAPGEGGTAMERIAGRLQRGEPLPGFGHPLYPDGDVRAVALLDALREMRPDAPTLIDDLAVAEAVAELTGRAPNVDFALAALARALDLPTDATLALFATGRVIGWIAHAQEQYRTPGLIRPRARYTGDHPRPAKP